MINKDGEQVEQLLVRDGINLAVFGSQVKGRRGNQRRYKVGFAAFNQCHVLFYEVNDPFRKKLPKVEVYVI